MTPMMRLLSHIQEEVLLTRAMEQLCAEEGIPETTYPSWMVG